ncbi:hypothetical protein POM88_021047 [Heracleum sosnowskyi]|uniref:BRISC and BRCA1-A complex member 2 n=1 Tax=Heracleum sosnowskyi TaxID=360622 RepID=A0AAD8MSG0_9APIA|nr:hypothetical protein POM88_021047 [Heracleum sosnowskyi]
MFSDADGSSKIILSEPTGSTAEEEKAGKNSTATDHNIACILISLILYYYRCLAEYLPTLKELLASQIRDAVSSIEVRRQFIVALAPLFGRPLEADPVFCRKASFLAVSGIFTFVGMLDKDQEIAVKRLSKTSKQGIYEFMNEVS